MANCYKTWERKERTATGSSQLLGEGPVESSPRRSEAQDSYAVLISTGDREEKR